MWYTLQIYCLICLLLRFSFIPLWDFPYFACLKVNIVLLSVQAIIRVSRVKAICLAECLIAFLVKLRITQIKWLIFIYIFSHPSAYDLAHPCYGNIIVFCNFSVGMSCCSVGAYRIITVYKSISFFHWFSSNSLIFCLISPWTTIFLIYPSQPLSNSSISKSKSSSIAAISVFKRFSYSFLKLS